MEVQYSKAAMLIRIPPRKKRGSNEKVPKSIWADIRRDPEIYGYEDEWYFPEQSDSEKSQDHEQDTSNDGEDNDGKEDTPPPDEDDNEKHIKPSPTSSDERERRIAEEVNEYDDMERKFHDKNKDKKDWRQR